MVINQITWIDEDKKFVTPDLWTIFDIKKTPEIWWGGFTTPPATVATEEDPIVTKWAESLITTEEWDKETFWEAFGWTDTTWETDLRVTKIWEVLTDKEKLDLKNKERDRIRNMEWITFEERNKMFRKLNEDTLSWVFYGWETQLDRERLLAWEQERKIKEQAWEAVTSAEDLFKQQLDTRTAQIRESWQKVMDTTQRLNSLRGWGRSSANETTIMEQQGKINDLVSAAEKDSALRLQIRRMEIEWAEAEAIAWVRNALRANEEVLNQRIWEAQTIQKELNDSIWADFQQSMDASMWILEAAWEDISGIDQAKSAQLWYFVNQDGSIYLNNAKNPVEFKSSVGSGEFSITELDDFATWISNWTLKFSDLKLDNRDIAKVMAAMNTKLDTQPWLSTNSLKAQRILKDLGLWTDAESVRTVTNLLKVNNEQEVRDMIATDEFKTWAFVAWNQKLFDDLRKDTTSFKDIDRTFKWMSQIWNDFKDNPSESRAAMEQALIIMFNKMLDPWSVVREGEFDRTSQGQSVMNAAEWYLQKLAAGWAWIKNEAFEDIVNIAEVLHEAAQDTAWDIKDAYKLNAESLWADPDFVDRFFDVWFDLWQWLEEWEQSQLDEIFGTTTWKDTTWWGFTTTSWFQFDFSLPDQTGWTKEIPETGFIENVNIARTGTNVAKDTNNPWNITADSIPAWTTKEQYAKAIGATWTYTSPNWREYFIFPTAEAWTWALQRDILAKISGRSRNIKPTDTLKRFQRVYVWEVSPNYLAVLKRITWAKDTTPIKNIDANLLAQAVMKAEWFNS